MRDTLPMPFCRLTIDAVDRRETVDELRHLFSCAALHRHQNGVRVSKCLGRIFGDVQLRRRHAPLAPFEVGDAQAAGSQAGRDAWTREERYVPAAEDEATTHIATDAAGPGDDDFWRCDHVL